MSQSPITVTYSLESVLNRLEEKIDKQFEEINRKIDKFDDRLNEKIDRLDDRLNEKIDKLDNNINEKIDKLDLNFNEKINNLDERISEKIDKFDERLNKLEIGQTEIKGDIKTLDEKVNGLSKRLETQEFVSRGILVALIAVILGGFAKLFGFVGNP